MVALFVTALVAVVAARHAEAQRDDTPAQLLSDRSLDLAFVRGRFPRGSEIWLRDSDSKRERLLLRVAGRIGNYWWAPGGSELMLRIDRPPYFLRLRQDGTLDSVDENTVQCSGPPFPAADGTSLACSETEIDVVRNGQSRTLVTEDDNVFINDVALSPNGKLVAVAEFASVEPASYGIEVIDSSVDTRRFSTSAPTQLLRKQDIRWSANSRRIAYDVFQDGDLAGFADLLPRWLRKQREAVIVLNERGRPTARLPGAMRPDWSRLGRIAFDRNSGGHREVFTVEVNGAHPVRLTGGPPDSWRPRWRP